jgi:adenosylcobinamide-GDP ribazoletransferase
MGVGVAGFVDAVRFLTRVPVPGPTGASGDPLRAVPWFPVVGGLVGAVVGGVYAATTELLPGVVAAVVAVVSGLLVTGAFHEDGLADSADALIGASHHDVPQGSPSPNSEVLRIMRDPTLGTYGVLALIASFAFRVTVISGLDGPAAVAILIAAHSLGRSAAVGMMSVGPVTPDGLGAGYAGRVSHRQIGVGVAIGLAIGAVALGIWVIAAAAGAGLGAISITRYARRRLGGVTGDILGAVEQMAEMAVLLVAIAVVHNGWGELPWWR